MANSEQGGFLRVVPSGAQSHGALVVTSDALPLPSGAATETTLAAFSARTAPLATSTHSRVSSSATVVTLLAANASRRSLSIYNESTATLYMKRGSAASITDYALQIPPGGYYEGPPPVYQGIITGLWSSANGAAQVVEGV